MGGAGVLGGGSADGDTAEEVVADVVGVGVDEVLGDAGEAREGGCEEAASVAELMARKGEVRVEGSRRSRLERGRGARWGRAGR